MDNRKSSADIRQRLISAIKKSALSGEMGSICSVSGGVMGISWRSSPEDVQKALFDFGFFETSDMIESPGRGFLIKYLCGIEPGVSATAYFYKKALSHIIFEVCYTDMTAAAELPFERTVDDENSMFCEKFAPELKNIFDGAFGDAEEDEDHECFWPFIDTSVKLHTQRIGEPGKGRWAVIETATVYYMPMVVEERNYKDADDPHGILFLKFGDSVEETKRKLEENDFEIDTLNHKKNGNAVASYVQGLHRFDEEYTRNFAAFHTLSKVVPETILLEFVDNELFFITFSYNYHDAAQDSPPTEIFDALTRQFGAPDKRSPNGMFTWGIHDTQLIYKPSYSSELPGWKVLLCAVCLSRQYRDTAAEQRLRNKG